MKDNNNIIMKKGEETKNTSWDKFRKLKEDKYKEYINKNFICFSVDIEHQLKNNRWKKNIIFQKGWSEFTLEKNYFNYDANGLALLTGERNNLFVIDIDDKKSFNKLLKDNNEKINDDWIIQMTGNGGMHIFFKYDERLKDIQSCSDYFNGKYNNIDIRTNGGCIIINPSSYKNLEKNMMVSYKWKNKKSLLNSELPEIPKFLLNILLEQQAKEKNKIQKNTQQEKQKKTGEKYEPEELSEEQKSIFLKGLNLLSIKSKENINIWFTVGELIYKFGFSYKEWDEWSKEAKNYNGSNDIKKLWKYRGDKNMTNIGIYTLIRCVKNDNDEETTENYINLVYSNPIWALEKNKYERENKKNKKEIKYFDLFDDGEVYEKTLSINTRYLMDLEQDFKYVKNPIKDTEKIINTFYDFLTNKEIKLSCLNSLMDSGKTQLLLKTLDAYITLNEVVREDLRILIITHRQSFANDMLKNYENLGFKCYLDKKNCSYLDNKIICSLESLHKITETGKKYKIQIYM
jgi:hypothetical protein